MPEYPIPCDHDGRRLDRLLRTLWREVPLGALMKAIRKGDVRLDGKRTAGDTRVHTGQVLWVPWKIPGAGSCEVGHIIPKTSLRTLYQDPNIWCIHKEAGVLSQPDTAGGDSIISRVLADLEWTRRDFRPVCVHRLDRNTSGVIMVALNGQFARLLSELLRERRIKKIYQAVVWGQPSSNGKICLPLKKLLSENRVLTDPDGDNALTLYRLLFSGVSLSCLELELVTGRSHQARVHLAALGYPILGDTKYGNKRKAYGCTRPFLHAQSVCFPLDERLGVLSGKKIMAPLPEDIRRVFIGEGWNCSGEEL